MIAVIHFFRFIRGVTVKTAIFLPSLLAGHASTCKCLFHQSVVLHQTFAFVLIITK